MRPALILAAVVACPAAAAADPSPAEQAEVTKLEHQLEEHHHQHRLSAAVAVARKLYGLQRKLWGADSERASYACKELARLLSEAGEHAEARKLLEDELKITERVHGAISREVSMLLSDLIGVYQAEYRSAEADPLELRRVEIARQLEGEHSTGYADALDFYGVVLQQRGEYSSAQRVHEQSLQIREAIAGSKDDPALIWPLETLGTVYFMTRQQPKAIAAFDRAIAIAAKAPAATHGGVLMMAAMQDRAFGREDLARPLAARSIALYEQEVARTDKDRPDDRAISEMLGYIAEMHELLGDLAGAERALERSVAIDDRLGEYGRASLLAAIKRSLGKPREALALYEKAKATLARTTSADNAEPYDADIADVLSELGESRRAEQLFAAHLAFVAKTFGTRQPIDVTAQLGMANIYMRSGKLAQAEQMLAAGLDGAERELSLVLRTGTEVDHATYVGFRIYDVDTAINFQRLYAPRSASAARLAMTTLLRRKGRLLDAAAATLATLRSRLSPDDATLLDDLAAARARLAKLTVGGGDHTRQLAALEDELHELELAVGKRSAAYRTVTQPVELSAVQKAIPAGAKLVEIVSFQPYDPPAAHVLFRRNTPASRRFAAYVLGTTGAPVLVDLGPVGPIDQAVEEFRRAASDPDNDRVAEFGRALFDLTFAKLVPALGGSTHVLLAPDGTLSVVPFSALVDETGAFLVERYTFSYLSSGRDLLRRGARTRPRGGGVIFADPSFDETGAAPSPASSSSPTSRGRRSVDMASLHWSPLPGTGQEADAIARTMPAFRIVRGAAATEGALKALHGPKVLHLATHGFFLPEGSAGEIHEDPLLRSGLALAGANKLASGDDDGILTALEASGLDLAGTRLVVLSACETGVGKVTNGDGVYGLRRALAIAGAESVVMTLWQVDDLATEELMAGYYAKLRAGQPRGAALRAIQLELRARDKYKHPFYWAGFLHAGTDARLDD